ncbi:MAG: hypothetical protein FJ098_16460, partial [Deltaproteobacteria bacterium]|nr:hypothetical protein [Deltaproteobacteria bacterium]
MRSALAWMSVLTLLAFACHGEDCECEKEAAKGETKPPAAEAPAAGPAAPPAAPAGVGEAPAEAAPPPDEIGWDRAQRLLQPLGRPLEYVKLTLQPERLAALGASDFHAFALADPGILLYVAEFPTPGAAAARAGGVAPSLQGWGLLVPTAAALNGHLVLVAGHGGDNGASPAALDMARRAGEAFGAAVELLPPTGEIPDPGAVIQ